MKGRLVVGVVGRSPEDRAAIPQGDVIVNLDGKEIELYCDVCCGGKENPSMHGKQEVSA